MYMNIIFQRKIEAPIRNILHTLRKFIYINGRTTKPTKNGDKKIWGQNKLRPSCPNSSLVIPIFKNVIAL